MKVLITGSKGFVGKNLLVELKNNRQKDIDILEYNIEDNREKLDEYLKECDFIYHLAGVNRPENDDEFMKTNFSLTYDLVETLKKYNRQVPIVLSSSIQSEKDNLYGKSKKAAEDLLFEYLEETGAKVFVYRLKNLFGKWCRPNYNSVVATFCYNIANNLDIQIKDKNIELNLCYIDDVVNEFINALDNNESRDERFCYIKETYKITLGELADKLHEFKKSRESLIIPDMSDKFNRSLYGTFLSYYSEDNFSYKLKKNEDNRGWLSEFIKSQTSGQIFISKTKPGITRGNHWHHTKTEKFLVIQGKAAIKFRKIDTHKVIEYKVDGEVPEVVDIPTGYTHSIENIGEDEVITLFWASEIHDPSKQDTYFLEV